MICIYFIIVRFSDYYYIYRLLLYYYINKDGDQLNFTLQ